MSEGEARPWYPPVGVPGREESKRVETRSVSALCFAWRVGERNAAANDTELCFVVYKRIKSRVTHPASQLWLHTSVIQPGKGGIVNVP